MTSVNWKSFHFSHACPRLSTKSNNNIKMYKEKMLITIITAS